MANMTDPVSVVTNTLGSLTGQFYDRVLAARILCDLKDARHIPDAIPQGAHDTVTETLDGFIMSTPVGEMARVIVTALRNTGHLTDPKG